MSEEKLYAVKNDEGKYWDFSDNDIFWSLAATRCPTTSGRNLATSTENEHGGHVVTLIEEPEKVVLTKQPVITQENSFQTAKCFGVGVTESDIERIASVTTRKGVTDDEK